ncbi:hypothetical protein ACFC06_00485 [Nocardia sp. NPDC056064]|uniref:hypothetical protein n=1 Tax=Nocardia sp. NPDC056064 TaxID=3345701 RepID=UPI0035D813CA
MMRLTPISGVMCAEADHEQGHGVDRRRGEGVAAGGHEFGERLQGDDEGGGPVAEVSGDQQAADERATDLTAPATKARTSAPNSDTLAATSGHEQQRRTLADLLRQVSRNADAAGLHASGG